jgi:hypothetical protein
MEPEHIHNKIHIIRNQRVILDKDLAEMYGVTTGNLNKAVRRRIERFPEDFMFQLTKEELILIFQIGTSSWGGTRKLPYAFTELGVAMLSSVLNSNTAVEVNMSIMRAFVTLRHALTNTQPDKTSQLEREINDLKTYLEEVFTDYNDINEDTRMQIELINTTLAELKTDKVYTNKPLRKIGFVNQE